MRSTPKIYHIKDVWKNYAMQLLAINKDWWGRYHSHVHNYYICRQVLIEGVPTVEVVFSYEKFRQIIDEFFLAAKLYVIEGEAINLGNHIGKICARRVERDHSNRKVNWGRTNLQPMVPSTKVPGKMVHRRVYFTEDDYSRIGLHKTGRIRNETVYEFVAAASNPTGTGFKEEFVRAINRNPLLKFRFIFFPLQKGRKKDIHEQTVTYNQTASA